jgi:multiple sugar transport system permease protein
MVDQPSKGRTVQKMRSMRELTDFQFALLLTLPVIVFLLALVVYPLAYAVWLSLHNVTFFGGVRFTFVGLENYASALRSPGFWHGLLVSVRFLVESLLLTMLIGLGMALVLNHEYRLSGLLRSLSILPWAVSRYAAGILFKYVFRGKSGVLTTLAYIFGLNQTVDMLNKGIVVESLAVGNAWNLAPLVGFFLLASMQTIPERLYDLAKIDNLGTFERFWHVTMPHIRYTLFVFVNIVAVLSLKTFDYIYVQTGGGPGTASSALTYEIYKESFLNLNLGYGAALSFYLLALIFITTTLLYVVWGRKEIQS